MTPRPLERRSFDGNYLPTTFSTALLPCIGIYFSTSLRKNRAMTQAHEECDLLLSYRTVERQLPTWITEELVLETLRVWQPYYEGELTQADAIEILMSIERLLSQPEVEDEPSVCSPGKGVVS